MYALGGSHPSSGQSRPPTSARLVQIGGQVRNGYGTITNKLAEGLDIRLNCAAKEIKYSRDGVEVRTANAGTHDQNVDVLKADAVLVTVPLGVLKHSLANPDDVYSMRFVPQLPVWKEAAIRRMGFGNLNKVVLCFDRVFWDPSVNIFGSINNTTSSRGDLFLFWSFYREPVLIGLVAGEAADVYEDPKVNDNLVKGHAMSVLKSIFSNVTVPEPKDFIVTRWRADPWARGSYSFVGVEATGDDYDIMSAPVSSSDAATPHSSPTKGGESVFAEKPPHRVFFAGEHTIRNYPATVHGALLSGLRDAGRIADQFLGVSYAV